MIASSNFLVPNATLIVEVVAFLIVLGFLGKYVLPVLNKALSERQEQIRTALEAAETARVEAAEAEAERQQTLDEARRPGPRHHRPGQQGGRADQRRRPRSGAVSSTTAWWPGPMRRSPVHDSVPWTR